jgi:hypothetical protein
MAPLVVLAMLTLPICYGAAIAETGALFGGIRLHPAIEFVSPHAEARVNDYPISIETKVTDFTLSAPVQYWDRVDGPDRFIGHIHYTLDDCPIFATSKTRLVMTKPEGKSLPVGRHVLRAELVNANHEPLNPPSFAEIQFVCERSAKAGDKTSTGAVVIDDRGRDQLQKLETQLQDVQKEISQLKEQLRDNK